MLFYSFPQGDRQSRLYLCFPTDQQSRFAGAEGPARFLEACKLACLNGVAQWSTADPAGPCGTFPGEDSRVSHPLGDGLVLIGDAAGYENPLQGQGLSMALQDAYSSQRRFSRRSSHKPTWRNTRSDARFASDSPTSGRNSRYGRTRGASSKTLRSGPLETSSSRATKCLRRSSRAS